MDVFVYVCTHTDMYMHVCIYTSKSYNKWVEGCLPKSICLPVQAPTKSWTRVNQVTIFNDRVTIAMGHCNLISKSRKQILIQEQKGSPQNFPQKILFHKQAIRNI